MNKIPTKLRNQLAADPYYKRCARANDGGCSGRITWEHSLIYAGRQVQERFAIIPLCVYHHLGDGLDKKKNRAISLSRATDDDMLKYKNPAWSRERDSIALKNK